MAFRKEVSFILDLKKAHFFQYLLFHLDTYDFFMYNRVSPFGLDIHHSKDLSLLFCRIWNSRLKTTPLLQEIGLYCHRARTVETKVGLSVH